MYTRMQTFARRYYKFLIKKKNNVSKRILSLHHKTKHSKLKTI